MKSEIRGPVLNSEDQGPKGFAEAITLAEAILDLVISKFKTGPRISDLIILLPFSLFHFNALTAQNLKSTDSNVLKIGLLADVQYCDCPPAGAREYRESLGKLKVAVTEFNREKVGLTVEVGDLIDRDFQSFGPVRKELGMLQERWVFVPGNHDFNVPDSLKKKVWKMIPAKKGYWSEVVGNTRLVYLNGFQNSVMAYAKGGKDYQENSDRLKKLEKAKAKNASDWNGGLGKKQLAWLADEVCRTNNAGQRLIVFGHQPIIPGEAHSMWDSEQLLKILAGYRHNVLYICGHKHSGGDETIGNTRIINLKGMVEQKAPSFGILAISHDHWEIKGFGVQSDYSGIFK